MRPLRSLPLLAMAILLSCAVPRWAPMLGAQLPPGFTEESIGGMWNEAVGLTFDSGGRMYVWERGGRVWIVEDGVRQSPPLIDLSEEVGGWRDYGLLGFALDPEFENNGFIYLLYVVDHHHLKHFGTPAYDPNANEYFQATIGRLARYTARASDGFRSVEPASRRVLIGERPGTGFPIMHQSHGTGTLVFGTDGTLLVSAGDGASYMAIDTGGTVGNNYTAQALAEGMIAPKEDVGAYRAQLVDSLAGKVLRVDPLTGAGVSSNPFFDAANPFSARSRVWALGFRNPYRMTLRPGTGSRNRADAHPGTIYIGDVGEYRWEELNIATRPGQNFGWPAFEGLEKHAGYFNRNVANLDAPNPLFGTGGCTQPFFYFRDLIQQESLDPNARFLNPCGGSQEVPSSIPRFVHSRPALDWKHPAGPARTGVYDAHGKAAVVHLGEPGSPVAGGQFGGECSVGGVWYQGDDFPPEYKDTYFHADFDAKWIRNLVITQNDQLLGVREFLSDGGGIVALATHPAHGGLYYVAWGSEVRKISYTGTRNQPPIAEATADQRQGPAPLTVQFNGSNSRDPEGHPLRYSWDFGDGSPHSDTINPTHTFRGAGGFPAVYTARLTVMDVAGASSSATILISVNSTPLSVKITSPVDGTKYPMTSDTVYELRAVISDPGQRGGPFRYDWNTFLHHNDHQHAEGVDTRPKATTVISPVGCDGQTYFYRIALTVTDSSGRSASDEVRLYPDCATSTNKVDTVWIEDALPAGAVPAFEGTGNWEWTAQDPLPFSGVRAHQSGPATGIHSHAFDNAAATLVIGSGDSLFAYVYLDPENPPKQVLLAWRSSRSILLNAGLATGGWEHRAYWGANLIEEGNDGTASRRYMGRLPPAGHWVRLEVPAYLVGLEGATLQGMAFMLHGGRAAWDQAGKSTRFSPPVRELPLPYASGYRRSGDFVSPAGVRGKPASTVWFDDAPPAGAWLGSFGGDAWTWISRNPPPYSGGLAHQSGVGTGIHSHWFSDAPTTLEVGPGEILFTHVFLDPEYPPEQVMLQWYDGKSWAHAAYWGKNRIAWGVDGTHSQRRIGPLPPAGQWVRLEVPASAVGLEGAALSGMNFVLYDGRATWDLAGKRRP